MKQSHVYATSTFIITSVIVCRQDEFKVSSVLFLSLFTYISTGDIVVITGTRYLGDFAHFNNSKLVIILQNHLLNDLVLCAWRCFMKALFEGLLTVFKHLLIVALGISVAAPKSVEEHPAFTNNFPTSYANCILNLNFSISHSYLLFLQKRMSLSTHPSFSLNYR